METLDKFVKRLEIRSSPNRIKNKKGIYKDTLHLARGDENSYLACAVNIMWNGKCSSKNTLEVLRYLGDLANSVQTTPEMYFKEWMGNPNPIHGLPRTEKLYNYCFVVDNILYNFLKRYEGDYLEQRHFLKIIKRELDEDSKLKKVKI